MRDGFLVRTRGLPFLVRGLLGVCLLLLPLLTAYTLAEKGSEKTAEEAARAEALALDQRVLAAAKTESEIMANLTHLSDIIGPRLTGSAALKRANDWAAEKMKSYGLSDVHLEGWTIPVGWERGTAAARVVEPDNGRTLSLAAMGWTPGTKGKITGEVVVLTARSSKELAAYKGKLKDAIVLHGKPARVAPITQHRPLQAGKPEQLPKPKESAGRKAEQAEKPEKADELPEEPNRRLETYYADTPAFRREIADFLRKEGAAVLIQDAGKPLGLLTMTGGWRGLDRVAAPEPLPAAFMAHEHYSLLYRLAMRPAPARTRVEIEIINKFIPGPIPVYNTVGDIKGTEKPDEYVILGAHLDSWDLACGTTDNGTGSVVVLEAARILARSNVKPKRTIRFVLFTGEEQGLHGSRAYIKKHKDALPRISMCLVHDTGTGKVHGIGLQGREAVKAILEPELVSLKAIGFKGVNLRRMGGTDHLSFEQAGVPGFAVQQDMSDYRLTHHTQVDTLDKAKEENLIQGAQVMAVTALRVANLPNLLPRERPEKKKRETVEK